MFSKLFGRKDKGGEGQNQSANPGKPYAFLGADMHSHFIPGIDDGAKTLEDSLAMLRAMSDMGYNTIITSPHIMVDYYPNTRQNIESGLQTVQAALKQQDIKITVRAAAEYYLDEYFSRLLENEPLLTIYKNEVLVEFSMVLEPSTLAQAIFDMQKAGYRPVIAHPERYMYFHKNFSKYTELKDRGCLLQLNLLSISGYYGRNIKEVADQLLKKGMYDYCGSDMHHERHTAALRHLADTKDYQGLLRYPFQNPKLCG